MKKRTVSILLGAIAGFALPVIGLAADDHHTPAPANASVDFGVLPTAPLGPPPCIQAPAASIGGPADPCAYKQHHLTPEEVTIAEGGQVTFQAHGGGHGITIYPVSANTTRDGIGQFLCAGADPATITDPAKEPCNSVLGTGATNAAAAHTVQDAKGNKVIIVSPNVTNKFPDNRLWYEPGRLMSMGGLQFINGGTLPAGAASDGQLITYRFLAKGRYLVICMNRSHSLNDWMFGFVNVVDAGDSGK